MSDVFKRFLKLESASGIILILAALVAIGLANSALAEHYQSFLNTQVQVRIAALDINKPLLLWINDGFMAIFFLLVGLEVKREMLEGALSSRVQATFPAIAAMFPDGIHSPLWIVRFRLSRTLFPAKLRRTPLTSTATAFRPGGQRPLSASKARTEIDP